MDVRAMHKGVSDIAAINTNPRIAHIGLNRKLIMERLTSSINIYCQ
jgi:hypothetical protein